MGTEISGIAKSILQVRAEMKSSLSGQDGGKDVSVSFMQLMSQNQFSSNAGVSANVKQMEFSADSKEWAKEAYGNYKDSVKTVSVQEGPDPKEALQEISEPLETYAEEVRQILKDELGVTDEEIADAMESLGICFLDLRNLKDLATLVQELTGEEIGTLFSSDTFQNVMEQVAAVTDALQTELGVAKEDWDAFCETVSPMKDISLSDMEAAADTRILPDMPEAEPQELQEPQESQQTVQEPSDEVLVPQADHAAEIQEEQNAGQVLTEDMPKAEDTAVTQNSVAVQADEAKQGQEEPVLKTEAAQEQEKQMEQPVAELSEEEGMEGDRSDSKPDRQSLWEHSKDAKPHDAGIQMAVTGQQAAGGEEFAVQAEAQPAYSSQIDAIDLIEQIARQVRVTVSAAATSMEMQLNPEHLGKIYLNISEREGVIRAQIAAQNETVKEALETQVAELRQSLHQQGVKVDAIEVTVATHEFEQNLEQNARQEEQMQQHREEVQKQARRNLNMNDLDGLAGLMSEEEELAARIMRDNGNQVDLTA